LLAQEVVKEFGGRVRFAVEDFGASPRAERFGIDKYPAVFVDDALVARPEEFYGWGGPENGRYVPWGKLEKRKKFQNDLRRMVELRLAGGQLTSAVAPQGSAGERTLPTLRLADLDGASFTLRQLAGKPVLVEFWATWCPPCLSTLTWLKQLDPGAATLVAVAVESEPGEVRRLAQQKQLPGKIVIGTQEIVDAFGGLPSIPTLFLADKNGKIVRAFYGAPPDLHEEIRREIEKLR
jgi:cytochrome c biogenesis protein CcmG/thiol:disulfide interchange protein DsbE